MRVAWFRGFWGLATVGVAGFIFYESTSGSGDPAVPDLTTALTYVGHVVVYAMLGFCAQCAVLSRRWEHAAAAIEAVGLYGLGLEIHQSTLEDREGSVLDAVANVFGAGLGVAAAWGIAPMWERWIITDDA
jgi:VanZ family protein